MHLKNSIVSIILIHKGGYLTSESTQPKYYTNVNTNSNVLCAAFREPSAGEHKMAQIYIVHISNNGSRLLEF